jgi:2-methylisocitrate lyase-like PEP mutase family enzyme
MSGFLLGVPDNGVLGLRDIVDHARHVAARTTIPILLDADTGFGNAVNVWHTVRRLERAGADAIQIEDQTFPKRCGHFAGKDVVAIGDMLDRVRAAADARTGETLIVARTDAAAKFGFNAAVDRAGALAEAGADVLFVEALETRSDLLRLPRLLAKPAICNMVVGGKTPIIDQAEGAAAGYGAMLYANTALQGALLGMQNALAALKSNGRIDEDSALVAGFAARQDAVDKSRYDAVESRFLPGG